jgi:mono/diheme cytochrome c family protein
MKKILKWTGLVLGSLLLLTTVSYGAVHAISVSRGNVSVPVQPHFAAVGDLADAELIAEGERIATVRGCRDCHGPNLAGTILVDDPAIGRIVPSNLTTGKGGRGSDLTDADWELAIRHGVRRDGRQLLVMPAEEFDNLTDRDVSAIIAYARSLPPVDNEQPPHRIGPLARVLHIAGQLKPYPASLIQHPTSHRQSIEPALTEEFGAYVAYSCTGCHGAGYSGGKVPGTPPDWIPAANITPDSATGIGRWTEDDFVRALREGIRPDDSRIDDKYMPIGMTKHLTDVELRAAYRFLRTVPAKAEGGR